MSRARRGAEATPGDRRRTDDRASLDHRRLAVRCREAEQALASGPPGLEGVELALGRLTGSLERELLASIYVREQDRLWLVAQRGYRAVRDCFPLEGGALARALRTGERQLVEDTVAEPAAAAVPGIRSELVVPFGRDGAPAGVLDLVTRGAGLPPEAMTLFDGLAVRLGRRLEVLRASLAFDGESLARLCVRLSSLRSIPAVTELTTRLLGRLLALESAQLDLVRQDGSYRLESFWRRSDSEHAPVPSAAVTRIARAETRSRATFTVLAAEALGSVPEQARHALLVRVPLRVGGREIGVVTGRAGRAPKLAAGELDAMSLFARHAAAVIDVAFALQREQRAAVTDPLTRLTNRRGFDSRLREELDWAAGAGRTLALLLVDCDGLKTINDTGGHELGDRVLQIVARCLRSHKRIDDVAARLGGDEFAVLLPDASSEDAQNVAERFRRELRARQPGPEPRVSATFGVALFPRDGRTPSDLLRAADLALYEAKHAGRDRTAALS